MEFKWKYCNLCETMMIVCPKCGNNTCNAGHGVLDDGTECDVCNLAYQYAEVAPRPDNPDNKVVN